MKDCLTKPIVVVNVRNLKPGDFIHDISYSSLVDSKKRKGYIISVSSLIKSRQIALELSGRKALLKMPVSANAVITRNAPLV